MAVNHKFIQTPFGNRFSTDHAILSGTPFEPEILFLGTFNPNTNENVNIADFYYGRNWFWQGLFNIIIHNHIHYTRQRKFQDLRGSEGPSRNTKICYPPLLLSGSIHFSGSGSFDFSTSRQLTKIEN